MTINNLQKVITNRNNMEKNNFSKETLSIIIQI